MCHVLRGELEGLLNQTIRSLRGRAESERDAALMTQLETLMCVSIVLEQHNGGAAVTHHNAAMQRTVCLVGQRAHDPEVTGSIRDEDTATCDQLFAR